MSPHDGGIIRDGLFGRVGGCRRGRCRGKYEINAIDSGAGEGGIVEYAKWLEGEIRGTRLSAIKTRT